MNNGPAWNKGIKFPHSEEWKQKRLSASRKAISAMSHPKGYRRPKEHTQPMLKALEKLRLENPEKYNALSTANLPKNTDRSKNGNWKGGITEKTRGFRWSSEYKHWRDLVFKRDGGKCRICGSEIKLQVHHIIPLSECRIIATLPMNGVVLCKKCHYENDEAWKGKRFNQIASVGKPLALIFTIPHKFHSYQTVGNWQFTKDGTIVIFVSALSDWRREALIAVHELVEVLMCQHDGVTQEVVDKFDKDFESARHPENEDEPGDEPNAPYVKQHCVATGIERILAAALEVQWKPYEVELGQLPEIPAK